MMIGAILSAHSAGKFHVRALMMTSRTQWRIIRRRERAMNRQQSKGSLGHAKHRKMGTPQVSGRAKLQLMREVNQDKPKKPEPKMFSTVQEALHG